MDINVIKTNNANEINKLVKKNCFNIVIGGNEIINRKALETKNVSLLLDPEPEEEDFMHFRNSGLNQVLVKLAKKNDVGIGFSINNLKENENKIDLLGKIMQNIMLCNKYKVKMYIVELNNNKHNLDDLKSLGSTLGISPGKVNILQIRK
mgnify:CR=1 FL=1